MRGKSSKQRCPDQCVSEVHLNAKKNCYGLYFTLLQAYY